MAREWIDVQPEAIAAAAEFGADDADHHPNANGADQVGGRDGRDSHDRASSLFVLAVQSADSLTIDFHRDVSQAERRQILDDWAWFERMDRRKAAIGSKKTKS